MHRSGLYQFVVKAAFAVAISCLILIGFKPKTRSTCKTILCAWPEEWSVFWKTGQKTDTYSGQTFACAPIPDQHHRPFPPLRLKRIMNPSARIGNAPP